VRLWKKLIIPVFNATSCLCLLYGHSVETQEQKCLNRLPAEENSHLLSAILNFSVSLVPLIQKVEVLRLVTVFYIHLYFCVYNRKPMLSDPFLSVEWPFLDYR